MTDRYAVFGNPIEHSKSPLIHSLFAAQTGEDLVYERVLVELGGFAGAADMFFRAGGKGLNITVPFKLDAQAYAHQLTLRASRAAAVNTLALQTDGSVLGDNTDGAGLVRDVLNNLGWPLQGKRVLVLGAGGAVRGVLAPLLGEDPEAITIANRTVEKATELAAVFTDLGAVDGCGFADLDGRVFDLVINGTSASLAGNLPPLPPTILAAGCCCYDMMYASKPTVFMGWASRQGAAQVVDGLGMLVEQAAEAFYLWRGLRPETAPVITDLRESLTLDV